MKKAKEELGRLKSVQDEESQVSRSGKWSKKRPVSKPRLSHKEEPDDDTNVYLSKMKKSQSRKDIMTEQRKSASTARSGISKSIKQERADSSPFNAPPDSFRPDWKSEVRKGSDSQNNNNNERATATWGERPGLWHEEGENTHKLEKPKYEDIDDYVQMRLNQMRDKEEEKLMEMLRVQENKPDNNLIGNRSHFEWEKTRQDAIRSDQMLDFEVKKHDDEGSAKKYPYLNLQPNPSSPPSHLFDSSVPVPKNSDNHHKFEFFEREKKDRRDYAVSRETPTSGIPNGGVLDNSFSALTEKPKVSDSHQIDQKITGTKYGWKTNSDIFLKSSPLKKIQEITGKINQNPSMNQERISENLKKPHPEDNSRIIQMTNSSLYSNDMMYYPNLLKTNQSLPTPKPAPSASHQLQHASFLTEIFSIHPSEDFKVESQKKERDQILKKIDENDNRLSVVNNLIARLTSKSSKLLDLGRIWRECLVCSHTQIEFLERIKSMGSNDEIRERIALEMDYWINYKIRHEELISKLKRRDTVRQQIYSISQEFTKPKQIEEYNKSTSSCYNTLRTIDKYLLNNRQKDTLYKGIKIDNLVKIDLFEEEYLRKMQSKISNREKYF